MHTDSTWNTRPETPDDVAAIRAVNLAAFPTPLEADLVERLREDPSWVPGLSWVAEDAHGTIVGFALLTRCTVGEQPALTLGPCAVLPEFQGTGVGAAVIRAALAEARDRLENLVTCLGHPAYYPRFGFRPASQLGVSTTMDVPDEAMMALALLEEKTAPRGTIRYPAPFGV